MLRLADKFDRTRLGKAKRYLDDVKGRAGAAAKKTTFKLGKRVAKGSRWLGKQSARRILSGAKTAGRKVSLSKRMRKIDGHKIDDLSRSQEDELRELLARNGDDGVEAINDLDGDTTRRLLDMDASCSRGPVSGLTAGSCLSEETLDSFRDSVAKASRDADLSYGELDDVVRRVDGLDGEKRAQAIRFIAKTDADGIEAVSDLSDDELRKFLSITYDGKIDGDGSFVDSSLTADEMVEVAQESDIDDTLMVVRDGQGRVRWLEWNEGSNVGLHRTLEKHRSHFEGSYGITSEKEIKEIIYRALKNSDSQRVIMKPNDGGGTRYFIKLDGHETPVRVAVSENGFILKAFPDEDAVEYFD